MHPMIDEVSTKHIDAVSTKHMSTCFHVSVAVVERSTVTEINTQ